MSPPRHDDDGNTPIDHPLEAGERDKMIRQMYKALIGDPLSPDRDKRGFIAIYYEHHRDYYGDKELGIMGSKTMIQKLWDMKLKFAGIVIAASAIVTIITLLIESGVLGKH